MKRLLSRLTFWRRKRPAAPELNRYGHDESRRWRPPVGAAPRTAWMNRPERDIPQVDLNDF